MQYTVKQAKEEIKNGIRGYLQKNDAGEYVYNKVNRIPFYLEGKPGIGKTEIVRQIADELGIGFVSFSITHHTRNSLLGLPVISNLDCGKYTEYTMSEIIAASMEKAEAGQKEGILLLDEFNCASETIMPTMLAFLQTRNIGKYELPEGWCIVLCGNPKEYNKSARVFDAAILDRVRKLSVEYEIKDFLDYAAGKDFHPCVQEYLEGNRQNFYRCNVKNSEEEVVTCRGWENLSHTLKVYESLGQEINEKLIHQYLKSEEVTHSFYKYYWMCSQSLSKKDIAEILTKKEIKKHIEKATEREFQYRWNLVEILGNCLEECVYNAEKNTVISKKIENVFEFLGNMKESGTLLEKFFYFINSSPQLLDVMFKVKNNQYLNMCRKEFGEMQRLETAYEN